jgi:hypothetical protein
MVETSTPTMSANSQTQCSRSLMACIRNSLVGCAMALMTVAILSHSLMFSNFHLDTLLSILPFCQIATFGQDIFSGLSSHILLSYCDLEIYPARKNPTSPANYVMIASL